jgi:hypothetical protein
MDKHKIHDTTSNVAPSNTKFNLNPFGSFGSDTCDATLCDTSINAATAHMIRDQFWYC